MPAPTSNSPGLAVMYHYVRADHDTIPGGIRPLLVSEFERQLDWLQQHYCIVSATTFGHSLASVHNLSKPPCLLTFDDGTRDHAEVITPILARRNLSGVFFILTGPAEEGLMPVTHGVHWLLGQRDEEIWRLFEQYARDQLNNPTALGDPAEAKRIYHYESELRGQIKYAANMAMPPAATGAIVQRAAEQEGLTLKELAREWFVSEDQIRSMHQAGMTIGLHGHSHSSLQVLGEVGIRQEIARGSAYLEKITGAKPKWWACPFGGTGAAPAVISAMQDAMKSAGLQFAVTTKKLPITRETKSMEIPRYDCIDLPPGKTSAPPELELS
jgi:peptidoglycan/xylan/chitin deacetylase (PgdA/CDA1 family)